MVRNWFVRCACILLFAITLPGSASAAPHYKVVDLSALVEANAVNDFGQVIGWKGIGNQTTHAFIWQNGVLTDLGSLTPTGDSAGFGINNLGQAVGMSRSSSGRNRGFLWTSGSMAELKGLGALSITLAYDVNDLGQVVGNSSTSPNHFRATMWQNGIIKDLGALTTYSDATAKAVNNKGHAVGRSDREEFGVSAVIWRNGGITDLGDFGGDVSEAEDINDSDQVVGFSRNEAGLPRAFLWQNGDLDELGDLGGQFSQALGISNLSRVVGYSETTNGSQHAFLWHPDAGMMDLNDLIDPVPGLVVERGVSINNKSCVLAWAVGSAENTFPVLLLPQDAPRDVSLLPSQGSIPSGVEQTFTTTYEDPDGALGLAYCRMLVNTSLRPDHAAYVVYDVARNKLFVRDDNDTSWMGGQSPGTAMGVGNGFCRLNCAGTTVKREGTKLTINWRITLKSPYRGSQCSAWMYVSDEFGLRDGWKKMGTFAVR